MSQIWLKRKAIEMAKESCPYSKYAAVIIVHKQVTREEYQSRIDRNPAWLGNLEIK
jgi:hypothetical protein